MDALLTLDPFAEMEAAMALIQDGDVSTITECTRPHVCYLPDGDIHVCNGSKCKFIELNEDKCYVCSLSGLCFGTQNVREDFSTGRQTGSNNPDDHAGEPMGGSWKPKKDMHAMSSAAYSAADQLVEQVGDEVFSPSYSSKEKGSPRVVKRGARCVDEPTPEPQQKRPRAMRRSGTDRDQFRAMQEDAEATLCKLVNFDKRPDAKSGKARDPRLQDKDALFQAAVKKYTKECLASGTVPTLDAVHNIALAAANIAADEKRKTALEDGKHALLLKVRMREQVTTLACSLWQASCTTPYMDGARRGADSFRPFVCGVFYALKRGVNLPDGTVVVPSCPQLAASLPALRSTAANSVAKALHASSHRGLCTLHRSISSCSGEQCAEVYENCARLARQLSSSVRAGRFDLC